MMRCKDVIKEKGVWVYRIREEGEYGDEETKVKNPYSERDIPLHSVLVDKLGFVKYVEKLRKQGKQRTHQWNTKKNKGLGPGSKENKENQGKQGQINEQPGK